MLWIPPACGFFALTLHFIGTKLSCLMLDLSLFGDSSICDFCWVWYPENASMLSYVCQMASGQGEAAISLNLDPGID